MADSAPKRIRERIGAMVDFGKRMVAEAAAKMAASAIMSDYKERGGSTDYTLSEGGMAKVILHCLSASRECVMLDPAIKKDLTEKVSRAMADSLKYGFEAQIKAVVDAIMPEPFCPNALKNGCYRIYWRSVAGQKYPLPNQHSLAVIGRDKDGKPWFAPSNWIGDIPCYQWDMVERVEPVETRFSGG